MELKIFWTNFAKNELKNIYNYHKQVASIKVAKRVVKNIALETKNLSTQPEMGQIEEILQNRPQNFRYLVHTNYKIIYWKNREKNRVEIVDIYDCRQNPSKIERNK